MSSAGIVLSQPPSRTTPSIGLARNISSAAIAAMLRQSIAVGRTCVSPRETTGRLSGTPPASQMPCLTLAATSSRCMLHGVRSDAVLAMAMCGRPSKAWFGRPRRIQARWMYGSRPSPAYHWSLRSPGIIALSVCSNARLLSGTLWNPLPATTTPPAQARLVGSDRVLAILRELAERPQGASLDDLSKALASPKATVHRALASLRRAGFAAQDAPGHYQLGDEFLRLAFTHHEARPDQVRVQPALARLAARFGETTHYAVLDGDQVVYRAKVDPPAGGVRLTSVVGGRNPAHTTGVGKLLLALSLPDDDAVRAWAADHDLAARTPRTITTVDRLVRELSTARRDGYAVDDEENELGIVCLAVPAYLTSTSTPSGAVSVSAVRFRTPLSALRDAVDEIRAVVAGEEAR